MLKNSNKLRNEQHPFHLVQPSPWPFMVGQILLFTALLFTFTVLHSSWFLAIDVNDTLVKSIFPSTFLCAVIEKLRLFFSGCPAGFYSILIIFAIYLYSWFGDVVTESVYEGNHTKQVQWGLRNGMVLFIVSEVMFFFSFFWAFFHFSIATSVMVGGTWIPTDVYAIDPKSLPFLNSAILLTSGATVTWAHNALITKKREQTILALFITVFLGLIFTFLQYQEYIATTFQISSGSYGSIFYVATGFHGLHVLIGSIFLLVCLIRQIFYHFTFTTHVGFEAAAWYWHFVDVVWLFLFIMVYWWSY